MKVALVHDWLNNKMGGAERVLLELARIYPEAPIYTLIYNEEKFQKFGLTSRIHTSYLQKIPKFLSRSSRYLLPFIPRAVKQFDFSSYDVVISSSSAFVKNIITPPQTLHICYCHAPMRFAWDYWPEYLDEQKVGPIRTFLIREMVSKLRIWDYYGAKGVDQYIANSHTTAQRIKKYYNRDSVIINPGIDLKKFRQERQKEDLYITLAMLTPYKKIDLVIEAFNQNGKELAIIGDGPQRDKLERLAGPNIRFEGFLDDDTKHNLLANAKALIFPNEEDFGIAPIEALASGTPVIAYGKGGVTETIEDGKTGVLFSDQTAASLNNAIEKFQKIHFNSNTLIKEAAKYDMKIFDRKIKSLVAKVYKQHANTTQLK